MRRTFEIGALLGDWYGLLEMRHNQSLPTIGETYFIRLTCQLFQGLRDYFILSCGAEMRHAKSQAEFFLPSFPVSSSASRGEAVQALFEYSPRSILEGAIKIFDPEQNSWESGYGGERWWAIATYTLSTLQDSIPLSEMIIQIDGFVYLVHNNGPALNKFEAGFIIEDTTQKFLTVRRGSNLSVMEILSFYRLGSLRYWSLVPCPLPEHCKESAKTIEKEIQSFLNDEGIVPCRWGDKELDLELADSPRDSEDDEEEEVLDEEQEEEQEESDEISLVSSGSEGGRS